MHLTPFRTLMTLCYVTWVLLALFRPVRGQGQVTRSKFKAAVYEHAVVLPQENPSPVTRPLGLAWTAKNLAVYEEIARLAKEQNADILVFPENGIYGWHFSTRDSIYPYLEAIPSPEDVVGLSLCSHSVLVDRSEVLYKLSCMANNNSIYIIANMADKVACNRTQDPNCPADGRYQFSTDVAFDPNGRLIAKYHKANVFHGEELFNEPLQSRETHFDTPFGRFGMLAGFDLLFKEPALTSIALHNVTNILLPVSWTDSSPLLSAVGFHSSFARALGVNVLAANLHLTSDGLHGSGIYTPDGVARFYDNNTLGSPGRLLVSEINVIKEPRASVEHDDSLSFIDQVEKDKEFQGNVSKDLYTFRPLEGTTGEIKVCQMGICCFLNYEMERLDESRVDQTPGEFFAFGAFDGLHTHRSQYYLQVCTLLRCADGRQESCGEMVFTSSGTGTRFKSLYLMAILQTMHAYPQVLLSRDGQLRPAPGSQWNFTSREQTDHWIDSPSGFDEPLVSATLLGRDYSRDGTLPKPSKRPVIMSTYALTNRFTTAHETSPSTESHSTSTSTRSSLLTESHSTSTSTTSSPLTESHSMSTSTTSSPSTQRHSASTSTRSFVNSTTENKGDTGHIITMNVFHLVGIFVFTLIIIT